MVEMHEYNESHADTCKTCKNTKKKYKNEDGQIQDYHIVIPIIKNKRCSINVSLSELQEGKKVRMKKDGNFYPSQLDALELDYDSDK